MIDSGVDVTRGWSLRLVAGLTVGVAVLSGCSEEPRAADTLPSADAPAATEEELPPLGPEDFPVPDAAREKTPEGALGFGEYYMSLGAQIGAGSIPANTLLDLSNDCMLCRQIAASYAADRAAGFTYQNFSSTFEEYGPPRITGEMAELGFVYTQSAFTVVDTSGKAIPERSGQASGELQSGMHLQWREDLHSWVVTSLTVG